MGRQKSLRPDQIKPSRRGESHPPSGVARGNCTPRPPSEPGVNVSVHRAPTTPPHQRSRIARWLLPVSRLTADQSWVARALGSTPITGASSLLRRGLPLSYRLGTLPLWVAALWGSPFRSPAGQPGRFQHRTTGSHVPHESLDQARAACMPDATWAVSRSPPGFSQGKGLPSVLTSSKFFSTLPRRFTFVRLLGPHLTHAMRLFRNAQHPGSYPAHLAVVCSLLLQGGCGGSIPPSPVQPRGARPLEPNRAHGLPRVRG